ncbi:Uncharacterised protein [Legionella bozemanae]|nr:Uncharacterised protein [Legionella bozemanae]
MNYYLPRLSTGASFIVNVLGPVKSFNPLLLLEL